MQIKRESIKSPRAGFTIVECTVALAVVAVLAIIVAQCVTWSLRERARLASHHAALEVASNFLEEARAQPFDKLAPSLAPDTGIPADFADLLPNGKVMVRTEAEKLVQGTRRLTVEVQWQADPDGPPKSIELTTLLAPREAKGATP